MNQILKKEKCANCGACVNVCPVSAINLNTQYVFYQLEINQEKCIQCGKCMDVCPVEKELPKTAAREAYWGYHKDRRIVQASSSGGAFTALASAILKQGGTVFGAAYDENKIVKIFSSQKITVDELCKSKYVESVVGDSFKKVKDALEEGQNVLFSGTPCQIAGLKSFLGKDYEKLYTCDFTCGGLSSHKMYREHLCNLEKRYRAPIAHVDFRPKIYGWSTHAIRVDFENGKRYVRPAVVDPYFSTFILKNVNARAYCYQCKFAEHHLSDVILADFWKYKVLVEERTPEKGISLLLANTEKGVELLKMIGQDMELTPISVEEASYNIKKKEYTDEHMKLRQEFLNCYAGHGLESAADLIGIPKGWRAFFIRIKCILKGVLLHLK